MLSLTIVLVVEILNLDVRDGVVSPVLAIPTIFVIEITIQQNVQAVCVVLKDKLPLGLVVFLDRPQLSRIPVDDFVLTLPHSTPFVIGDKRVRLWSRIKVDESVIARTALRVKIHRANAVFVLAKHHKLTIQARGRVASNLRRPERLCFLAPRPRIIHIPGQTVLFARAKDVIDETESFRGFPIMSDDAISVLAKRIRALRVVEWRLVVLANFVQNMSLGVLQREPVLEVDLIRRDFESLQISRLQVDRIHLQTFIPLEKARAGPAGGTAHVVVVIHQSRFDDGRVISAEEIRMFGDEIRVFASKVQRVRQRSRLSRVPLRPRRVDSSLNTRFLHKYPPTATPRRQREQRAAADECDRHHHLMARLAFRVVRRIRRHDEASSATTTPDGGGFSPASGNIRIVLKNVGHLSHI